MSHPRLLIPSDALGRVHYLTPDLLTELIKNEIEGDKDDALLCFHVNYESIETMFLTHASNAAMNTVSASSSGVELQPSNLKYFGLPNVTKRYPRNMFKLVISSRIGSTAKHDRSVLYEFPMNGVVSVPQDASSASTNGDKDESFFHRDILQNIYTQIQPDYVCSPIEVVSAQAGKKKCRQAADATLKYLESAIELQQNNDLSKKVKLVGSVTNIGGGSKDADYLFDRSVAEVMEQKISKLSGCLLDLSNLSNGTFDNMVLSVEKVMSKKPSQAEFTCIVFAGTSTPYEILSLIEKGADIIESSYPYMVTKLGYASTYGIDFSQDAEKITISTTLNMRDRLLALDQRPILNDCTCFTCRNHTRAYLHHLIYGCEMLGEILLFAHNLHHMLRYFKSIRNSIGKKNLEDMKQWFKRVHSKKA